MYLPKPIEMINDGLRQNVVYVKLGDYVNCYFQMKYGTPVKLPFSSPLHIVLETCLKNNKELKMLSENCYSELAFDYDRNGQTTDIAVATPTADEKDEFIPFVLPESVYVRPSYEQIKGGTWQLTADGTKRFRKLASREFWTECMNFINDCFCKMRARGEQATIKEAVSDFLVAYGIPMEKLESICHEERRKRKRMSQEIENRHSAMEERSGGIFIYT